MRHNYVFTHIVLLRILSYSNTMAYRKSDNNFKWLAPFDNRNKLATLCTQDNRELIMHHSGIPLVGILSVN